jgi:hypothetical protein
MVPNGVELRPGVSRRVDAALWFEGRDEGDGCSLLRIGELYS